MAQAGARLPGISGERSRREDWNGFNWTGPGPYHSHGRVCWDIENSCAEKGLTLVNRGLYATGEDDGGSGGYVDGEGRSRSRSCHGVFETYRGIAQGAGLRHVSSAPAQDRATALLYLRTV